MAGRDHVQCHEADIMAVGCHPGLWIAEADPELLALLFLAGVLPGALAPPLAGAAGALGAPGAAASATTSTFVGGTTVATTKSRSITDLTFSVPFRSCQRTLSLKSSGPRSAVELLRDLVGVAIDLDRVANDVEHGAAFDPGADAVVFEVDGNRHLDALT